MDPAQEDGGGFLRPLDRVSTRAIDRTGGHGAAHLAHEPVEHGPQRPARAPRPRRACESLETDDGRYDLTPVVLENLERLEVDGLVAIGGDDTLSYAARLGREGFPVIAIPKTMDNDVHGTEYCIGFSTAVTRAKELINRQRTTLGSHERIGVFRIFGRNAGYTAWYAAYVTSARCVIPEAPVRPRRPGRTSSPTIAASIPRATRSSSPARAPSGRAASCARSVSADAYGHRHKADVGEALAEELKRRTGIETVHSDLTYDLRSGDPDALDQMVAITFANVAVDLLADGQFGRMVAIRGGKYCARAAAARGRSGARTLDVEAMYNAKRFRPRYEAKLGSPLLLGPAVIE